MRANLPDQTASHFKILLFSMKKVLLNCTVTTEKAAMHIAASEIRKKPHTETFKVSSSCCINL